MTKTLCPCGSKRLPATCCQRFISGACLPGTPEELMRSRYTAYTQANIDYISQTMKSPAADGFDADDAKAWARSVKWLRLEVLNTSVQGNVGHVEFRAYYSINHKTHIMHERSEFHLDDGQWYYVDGNTGLPSP